MHSGWMMDGARVRSGARHSIVITLEPSRVTGNTALCLLNSFANSASGIAKRSAVDGRRDRDDENSRTI